MKLRSLAIGLTLVTAGTVIGATTQQFASAEIASGDRPVLVPIEPCRLVDTRPGDNTVGPKSSPLGAAETLTIDAQEIGTACTGAIPADALSLSLNVTAIGASEQSFLTIWAGGTRPDASSLNPAPGEPPTPNAVTVDLSIDQEFEVYNNNGSVNLIVDINGYYETHSHDDRYYTEAEVDALVPADPIRQTVTYSGITTTPAAAVPNMVKFRDLGTFTSTGGVVRIEWASHVQTLGGANILCSFGVRVDGTASAPLSSSGRTGTEAVVGNSAGIAPGGTLDVFLDLPAGDHDLDLFYSSNGGGCRDNGGGFLRTVHITETSS